MLKISFFLLLISFTCFGKRIPSNKHFQRQQILESAPYPASGYKPNSNEFELPTEDTSVEQLELNRSEIESFNRLKTNVKSDKLVQERQQSTPSQATNTAPLSTLEPSNYVQQTSIQTLPVQPQIAYNFPLNYAPYLQPSVIQLQQGNVVGLGIANSQPTIDLPNQQVISAQFQQPFQQQIVLPRQFQQQSTIFGGQQQLLQNCW